jgi:hypothetical protein
MSAIVEGDMSAVEGDMSALVNGIMNAKVSALVKGNVRGGI